ncbi:hypothetical protein DV735_g4379, partial [Chaetothyriales sp. CBS 134920]
MSVSSSPLGPTTAARRPALPPPKASGLSSDLQARMKAFSLSRPPGLKPQQGPAGPFVGGALAGTQPGAQQFGRLPPQLSRANAPSLNSPTSPPGPPRLMSPQSKPGGLAAKRGLKPGGMKLSDVLKPAGDGEAAAGHDTGSQFNKFQNIVDTQKGTLNFKDKAVIHGKGIEFEGGSTFSISLDEIDPIDELGKGNYGTVFKVRHARPRLRRPGLGIRGAMNKSIAAQQSQSSDGEATSTSGLIMAMKEIRLELEDTKFAQIIMELDILHRCVSPFIIDFYGAFFQEGSVYICIEYMDGGSIDKLYADGVPEGVLRKITSSTVLGLKTLKDDYNIIHRDVKPTNILVNTRGQVKICDFGVSGNLVASIAKTNIGCQSYMAPERISGGGTASAGAPGGTYSVQSDVWSLGLTIIECALGRYPYPPETYDNIFSQLNAIVEGEPPSLPAESYSPEAIDFVRKCLHKVPKMRPTYAMLLRHPWLAPLMKPPTISEDEEAEAAAEAGGSAAGSIETTPPTTADKEVADWVKAALAKKQQGKLKLAKKPALHEAPLDAVPGSPLLSKDEVAQDEDRIKPNPGVRLHSPELQLAQVESTENNDELLLTMPGLVRKVLIFASVNGLVVQAHGPVEHGRTIRVNYGTQKIEDVSVSGQRQEAKSAGFGPDLVLGLLSIASASFLVAITQREQVAQIFGKPVYVVTDVALLPLSSQRDAAKAIVSAKRSSAAAEEATDSDYSSDSESDGGEYSGGRSSVSSSLPDDSKDCALPAAPNNKAELGPGIAQDVYNKRAHFGTFATQWFSRRGWSASAAPDAASSSSDASTAPAENKTANAAEQAPTTAIPPPEGSGSVRALTPNILRNARLILGSRSFFFSYEFDLTRRISLLHGGAAEAPSRSRLDSFVFWNRHLARPLFDAQQDSFLIPIIQGFVGQRTFSVKKATQQGDRDAEERGPVQPETGIEPGPGEESESSEGFLLTIISRRSAKRSGLRYLRRGIDDEGNCANSVETEQILSAPNWDRSSTPIHSFVQLRASIPLFFSQSPYAFKPLPQLHRSQTDNEAAFRRHFSDLKAKYGAVQIGLLVDQHGNEVAIGQAYESTFKRLKEEGDSSVQDVGFEWFDFHAECRGMRFDHVSRLVDRLRGRIDGFGETVVQDGVLRKSQTGIVRTNCMDCLDRTNVVESALGQYMLQTALSSQGFEIDLVADQTTTWFNTLWADNGDAISRQYAGTAALKGDFTRTRKRKMQGAVFDLSLTLTRYYKNMFNDYFSQAVIDLLLGNISWKAFDEFEATMKSADPGLSIARVRANAVETCRKVVIQDEHEDIIQAWTVLAPAYENTLRTLPFQEAVLLLSDSALYCCRFDWTTEKVSSYERVDLRSIFRIRYGTYIVSTVTEGQMDQQSNVGLAVAYRPGKERTNTRSLQTHVEANSLLDQRIDGGTGILSWTARSPDSTTPSTSHTLAVKIIPPASDSNRQSSPAATQSPLSIAQEYSQEIGRAIKEGRAQEYSQEIGRAIKEAKAETDAGWQRAKDGARRAYAPPLNPDTREIFPFSNAITITMSSQGCAHYYAHSTVPPQYRGFASNIRTHSYADQSSLPTAAKGQKIFISSQFWTNAHVIEARWGEALLKLVDVLGPENVYVSIYESGSLDNTKAVLSQLDAQLAAKKVARSIVLDTETHADLIHSGPYDQDGNPRPGWLLPPSGSNGKEIRRIPHLAKTRNLSLQPLLDEKKKHGRSYDKVLFLNDVVFQPQDVVSLLATNGGSYSVACAIDFQFPAAMASLYDTFALRDARGARTLAGHFPYFRAAESRQAVLRGDSAPVQSCWNGMVLMDASPFYPSVGVDGRQVDGLRFRAISDSLAAKHLEASECCLINADLAAMGAAEHGIYINPAVRVAYTDKAYNLTHTGADATGFITASNYLLATWLFRLAGWVESSASRALDEKVHSRVAKWQHDNTLEHRNETGEMCLIDEMHLLIWNGWKHA